MKRTTLLIFVTLLVSAFVSGQDRVVPNKPFQLMSSGSGYMTINELNVGFGLGETGPDYSKSFVGITSIHGYQINKTFFTGGGIGFLSYNGGMLVPLYADVRANIIVDRFTPYVSGDAGLLLNLSDLNGGTRMFINPQAGVRYSMSSQLAVCFAIGPWIQMGGGGSRDAFLNIKLGAYFMPR